MFHGSILPTGTVEAILTRQTLAFDLLPSTKKSSQNVMKHVFVIDRHNNLREIDFVFDVYTEKNINRSPAIHSSLDKGRWV